MTLRGKNIVGGGEGKGMSAEEAKRPGGPSVGWWAFLGWGEGAEGVALSPAVSSQQRGPFQT